MGLCRARFGLGCPMRVPIAAVAATEPRLRGPRHGLPGPCLAVPRQPAQPQSSCFFMLQPAGASAVPHFGVQPPLVSLLVSFLASAE